MEPKPVLVPKLFGLGRHAIEVDDAKGELTKALMDQEKYSRGWRKVLHPRTFELIGYESPWED